MIFPLKAVPTVMKAKGKSQKMNVLELCRVLAYWIVTGELGDKGEASLLFHRWGNTEEI